MYRLFRIAIPSVRRLVRLSSNQRMSPESKWWLVFAATCWGGWITWLSAEQVRRDRWLGWPLSTDCLYHVSVVSVFTRELGQVLWSRAGESQALSLNCCLMNFAAVLSVYSLSHSAATNDIVAVTTVAYQLVAAVDQDTPPFTLIHWAFAQATPTRSVLEKLNKLSQKR